MKGRNESKRGARWLSAVLAMLLAVTGMGAGAEVAFAEDAVLPESDGAGVPPAAAPSFDGELLLTGTVGFRAENALKAPVSGDLDAFDWRAGDTAAAGETLFSIAPETVYATFAGTVGEVFAAAGDDAAAVQARYGALMAIDEANPLIVSASAQTGYDTHANKRLALGETLYLRSRESGRYTGVGRVVKVSGMSYTVEVVSGNLRFDESVNLYRSEKYDDTTRVGRATVTALDARLVTAQGTVLTVLKARGDAVNVGDALLTYVPDALSPEEYRGADTARAAAPRDLVLTQVNAAQGAAVQKGQVLAVWADARALRFTAKVAEADVGRLAVGMTATLTFEDLNAPAATGVVAGVSAIGSQADESEYSVYINFDAGAEILCGMHGTALFN